MHGKYPPAFEKAINDFSVSVSVSFISAPPQ